MRSCYEIYTFTKQVIIMKSFSIDYCDIIPITSTIFQYVSKCVMVYCALHSVLMSKTSNILNELKLVHEVELSHGYWQIIP